MGVGGALVLIVFVCFVCVVGQWDENDVRTVCLHRQGVARVTTGTWDNFSGSAVVVCRDGSVGAIRNGKAVTAR